MGQNSNEDGWNTSKLAGAILTGTAAVGVIAYLVRRGRRHRQRTPAALASKAYEQTRDAVSNAHLEAGRDFLVKTVIPEFKPAIQALLDELKVLIDNAFTRAEKALKEL